MIICGKDNSYMQYLHVYIYFLGGGGGVSLNDGSAFIFIGILLFLEFIFTI